MDCWEWARIVCRLCLVGLIVVCISIATGCSNAESSDNGTGSDTGSDTNPNDLPVIDDLSIEYVQNPYGNTLLVAVVVASHEELVPAEVNEIQITIEGLDEQRPGLTENIYPQTPEFQTNFNMDDIVDPEKVGVPLLGLYPDANNDVVVRIYTDEAVYVGKLTINTPAVSLVEGETITVEVEDKQALESGWTILHNRMFDHLGNCRWVGPNVHDVLSNGNILDSSKIDEWNVLGRPIINRSDDLPSNLETHHSGIELDSGNIIACVSNSETSITSSSGSVVESVEDYIIELDYETSVIVNAWDAREFFDVDRQTVNSVQTSDWLHMNTLCYDENDDSLIISARYQGIAKLTRSGIQGDEANKEKELVWLLAPHLDWGMAGWDGQGDLDTNDYLLTAVDSKGVPYDDDVQNNLAPPSDDLDEFHWPVGQHGLQITSREGSKLSLLVFNNQASVIFDGPGSTNNQLYGDLDNDRSSEPYSQMIEYEIDEVARTVRQKWSYGHEMPEYYCSYRSGIDLFPVTNHRILYTCGIDRMVPGDPFNPHVVEVTEQGEVLYHLEIEDTDLALYRANRLNLYHPDESGK